MHRGHAAEAHVASTLQADGWTVVARNWSAAGGELDVVVRRGHAWRFVEVRARQPGDSSALESVDYGKRRRLIRAAEAWLASSEEAVDEVAFMVAEVVMDPAGWQVHVIDDAFDG